MPPAILVEASCLLNGGTVASALLFGMLTSPVYSYNIGN